LTGPADLPTVEIDLQQLLDGVLEIRGQQESWLAQSVTITK
jgi:hypothetical protein